MYLTIGILVATCFTWGTAIWASFKEIGRERNAGEEIDELNGVLKHAHTSNRGKEVHHDG